MRGHAHEGDIRTEGPYIWKDIYIKRHIYGAIYTRSDIQMRGGRRHAHRRDIHTEHHIHGGIYTWRDIHMERHTHDRVYIGCTVHRVEYTQGGLYTG